MNVIKYKYYSVVTDDNGVYLLFTYLGLPFRDLTVGNIDASTAYQKALTSIQPELLEERDNIQGELLDLSSLIGSFIPLEEINILRSLNMTTLNNMANSTKERLSLKTERKNESIIVDDSEMEISYEYDPQYPSRIHGLLLIKKKGSEYVHLYVMVEGNAVLYVRYTNKGIEEIVELTSIPHSLSSDRILWFYDINTNDLLFGQQTIQYVHEKRGVITIDGFKLLYNNFHGPGTIQFDDYNYVPRKITVIPDKNWWKYYIFLPDEREVTYITSGLIG